MNAANVIETKNEVFDYRILRLLVGIIAFILPWVVSLIASEPLASISHSYYSEAKHWFVGLLFVVSAFLLAYNGHTTKQMKASKVAALAAFCVAVFPTAAVGDDGGFISTVHILSAGVLFSLLVWFCFAFFRRDIKAISVKEDGQRLKYQGETQTPKELARSTIYLLCGYTMILCMLAIAIAKFLILAGVITSQVIRELQIVYWSEAIALGAFGVAWFTAGHIRLLADEKDAINILEPVIQFIDPRKSTVKSNKLDNKPDTHESGPGKSMG